MLGKLGYSGIRLGHISGSVVTRPTPSFPHIYFTYIQNISVLVLGRTGAVYFDRLLGSTWRTPSWRTNRSKPALIHLFWDLVFHNFLTSCCILHVMANVFALLNIPCLRHFPRDWCSCCLMYHQMQSVHLMMHQTPLWAKNWGFKIECHITILTRICTHLEDELACKISTTFWTIVRSRIVQEDWPWI